MNKFHDWWLAREAKERQTLLIGGSISAILLTYLLIWQPLNNAMITAKKNVSGKARLAGWMTVKSKDLTQLRANNSRRKQVTKQSLLVIVNNSLQTHNLNKALNQIKQTHDNQLNLQFDAINFYQLSSWLITLEKHDQIHISQFHVDYLNQPGKVKATLYLTM